MVSILQCWGCSSHMSVLECACPNSTKLKQTLAASPITDTSVVLGLQQHLRMGRASFMFLV